MDAPLKNSVKKDGFYHKDICPLDDLPIDISSVVVLEYMFILYLFRGYEDIVKFLGKRSKTITACKPWKYF